MQQGLGPEVEVPLVARIHYIYTAVWSLDGKMLLPYEMVFILN